MYRRRFLFAASAVGVVGTGGCLSATKCDETSNHLYIENQLPEPQEIDVQVTKESGRLFADREWTTVFHDSVDLSGEDHRVIEGIYDEHGTYRTAAERVSDHDTIYSRETSDVDSCRDQSITIGIADGRIDVLHGVPDRLASETTANWIE